MGKTVNRVNMGVGVPYTKKGSLELIQQQRKMDKKGDYYGWGLVGVSRGGQHGVVFLRLDVIESSKYYTREEAETLVTMDNYQHFVNKYNLRTQDDVLVFLQRTVEGWTRSKKYEK